MIQSRTFRNFALLACFALFNACVPFGAVAMVGTPAREGLSRYFKGKADAEKRRFKTRELTAKEGKSLQGKTGACPYLAGQNKWDIMHDGIDLMSGNFSNSVTDLSFDGGYGIPVNVTRSYSSNDGSEEPFGYGWSLSADVRNTAGGLLKSKSSPIRSVPNLFKERSSLESDPNVATQPVTAVTSTDASGRTETIQKDIDGILTTPPWDSNVSTPTYTYVTLNSAVYQVQSGNVTTTIDGTVYQYATEGTYPSGTVPYNNSSATPQAANVLKVTSVTDRQGNVTTYGYGSSYVTFNKIDGQTSEHPLLNVTMPNGHVITFTWGNGTNAPTNRIVSASDGTRTVLYGYTNIGGQSMLTSTTSPAGLVTNYGYTNAQTASGWTGAVATNLLSTITTPQGLTTTMAYQMLYQNVFPYLVKVPAPVCQRVIQPNGIEFYFGDSNFETDGLPDGDWPQTLSGIDDTAEPIYQIWWESMGQDKAGVGVATLSTGGLWATGQSGGLVFGEEDRTTGDGPASLNNKGFDPGTVSTYDPPTQNLLDQISYSYPYSDGVSDRAFFGPDYDLSANRYLQTSSGPADLAHSVEEATTYNFAGTPLSKTDTEGYYNGSGTSYFGGSFVATRVSTTSYAYWDGTKYFQKKATMDSGGRYSYTDYYPNNAPAGSRGQQYQVFDPGHATWENNGVTPPSYAATADYWKYQLYPLAGTYSAQFSYDSVGRCNNVYKLQSSTSNPWKYVQTATTYGANGSPTWGQATKVVEDSAGIARTTQTTAYTSWGKPSTVQDAAGHVFVTVFDLDGKIQTVTRTDVSPNVTVASYSYGTSGINKGQPISITDGLSGVSDSIVYQPSGPGIGQVASSAETNGSANYSVAYAYNTTGDRWQTTYTTPSGTKTWQYDGYETVGETSKAKRVFQTLTLLSSGNPTAEQMQYAYSTSGTLRAAAYAQTPAVGFTPTAGNPWYDSSHFASVRARTWYAYDAGGRVLSDQTFWDTFGSNGYSSSAVLDNECSYETSTAVPSSNLDRGVKTGSSFYVSGNLDHSESYSYDPKLDYLTGANYGDGLPNATPSWTYDAAGNRTDTVADNLNRPTTINGVSSTSDILGNRLTLGSQSYGWDCLNRMISYGTTNSYVYRADGMRVSKVAGSTSTVYRYDGQMGMEDVDTTAGVSTITDYGLGVKGIDYIASTKSGSTSVGFPIYDAHGNMSACLFRSGTTSFTLGNQRHYDAWGIVRNGATTGDPKGRYCASLGHKQDDESGLVYMRARYYEPSSGRFLSQDRNQSGINWFSYCDNEPISRVDPTGNFWWFFLGMFIIGMLAGIGAYATFSLASGTQMTAAGLIGAGALGGIAGLFGGATGFLATTAFSAELAIAALFTALAGGVLGAAAAGVAGGIQHALSPVSTAVMAEMGEQLVCAMELSADSDED